MNANDKNPNGNVTSPAGNAAERGTSLLKFEHIVRKTSPGYSLDTRVLDQLDSYPEYIKTLTGHAPEKDEVVEKALQHVFASDAGFKRYFHSGTGGRGIRRKNANRSAAETPETTAAAAAGGKGSAGQSA